MELWSSQAVWIIQEKITYYNIRSPFSLFPNMHLWRKFNRINVIPFELLESIYVIVVNIMYLFKLVSPIEFHITKQCISYSMNSSYINFLTYIVSFLGLPSRVYSEGVPPGQGPQGNAASSRQRDYDHRRLDYNSVNSRYSDTHYPLCFRNDYLINH